MMDTFFLFRVKKIIGWLEREIFLTQERKVILSGREFFIMIFQLNFEREFLFARFREIKT